MVKSPGWWATTALLAAFIAVACATAGAYSRIRYLEDRLERLERRKPPPPPAMPNLDPLQREVSTQAMMLDALRKRTDDVREVLETLIRVDRWPGRERLPTPVSDWPEWPTPGEHVGSVADPNYFPPPPRL